jgi:hypothetical protein
MTLRVTIPAYVWSSYMEGLIDLVDVLAFAEVAP